MYFSFVFHCVDELELLYLAAVCQRNPNNEEEDDDDDDNYNDKNDSNSISY